MTDAPEPFEFRQTIMPCGNDDCENVWIEHETVDVPTIQRRALEGGWGIRGDRLVCSCCTEHPRSATP